MTVRLVVATTNLAKVAEFRSALSPLGAGILSAEEVCLTTFPEETGASYLENARLKAEHAALKTDLPALADDSGLEVEALNGAPGIYSARFGGPISNSERITYLLQQLRGVPRGARGARFVCGIVLATPGGEVESFHSEAEGEILFSPRGEGGFGYDPVFYSPELGRTFAEVSREEKQRVSHRGKALQQFVDWALTPPALAAISTCSQRGS